MVRWRVARAAEDAGFTSLWVMNHFLQIPQTGEVIAAFRAEEGRACPHVRRAPRLGGPSRFGGRG